MNIKRKGLTVGALLLCMNLSTFAQSVKLNLKGVSVERAMTELREKSGYSFVFAASDVNTHKVINVNAKDLKQAIGQILDGQNVSYQIKEKNIVVAKGVKLPSMSVTVAFCVPRWRTAAPITGIPASSTIVPLTRFFGLVFCCPLLLC